MASKPNTGLRQDVREAIERVWPNDVIKMTFDPEQSYFEKVHPNLTRDLGRIGGASLIHERNAEGGPVWFDESDPDEDLPDDLEHSRSYHLYFVSPEGKAFVFENETEGPGEPEFLAEEFEEAGWGRDLPERKISGRGRTGWCVAVSLLAPFAVITLGEMSTFEDGTTAEPSIETFAETLEGERIDPEQHFRKTSGEPAFKALLKLRVRIVGILKRCGVSVLPQEEWRKPVPWLRADEEVLAGIGSQPIRVLDALFFEGM